MARFLADQVAAASRHDEPIDDATTAIHQFDFDSLLSEVESLSEAEAEMLLHPAQESEPVRGAR
jgi:hypothetical protein